MGNLYQLDIHTTDFGNLVYNLAGCHGLRESMSNMRHGNSRDLPATVDDYQNFQALMCDLIPRIDSSNLEIDQIVFQKYRVVEQDYVSG